MSGDALQVSPELRTGELLAGLFTLRFAFELFDGSDLEVFEFEFVFAIVLSDFSELEADCFRFKSLDARGAICGCRQSGSGDVFLRDVGTGVWPLEAFVRQRRVGDGPVAREIVGPPEGDVSGVLLFVCGDVAGGSESVELAPLEVLGFLVCALEDGSSEALEIEVAAVSFADGGSVAEVVEGGEVLCLDSDAFGVEEFLVWRQQFLRCLSWVMRDYQAE